MLLFGVNFAGRFHSRHRVASSIVYYTARGDERKFLPERVLFTHNRHSFTVLRCLSIQTETD